MTSITFNASKGGKTLSDWLPDATNVKCLMYMLPHNRARFKKPGRFIQFEAFRDF